MEAMRFQACPEQEWEAAVEAWSSAHLGRENVRHPTPAQMAKKKRYAGVSGWEDRGARWRHGLVPGGRIANLVPQNGDRCPLTSSAWRELSSARLRYSQRVIISLPFAWSIVTGSYCYAVGSEDGPKCMKGVTGRCSLLSWGSLDLLEGPSKGKLEQETDARENWTSCWTRSVLQGGDEEDMDFQGWTPVVGEK
ncbi:hypothetical protein CRENBAI_022360 [Crenichthys baileyi]|uniref:Uncharacterized protein n=1 Tax=Crenichthys baileyi TaxID=28760 RepID=A0AAV9RLS1_9TELE